MPRKTLKSITRSEASKELAKMGLKIGRKPTSRSKPMTENEKKANNWLRNNSVMRGLNKESRKSENSKRMKKYWRIRKGESEATPGF